MCEIASGGFQVVVGIDQVYKGNVNIVLNAERLSC